MIRLARIFGHSDLCESSWAECLSSAHREYIIDRVQQEEAHEEEIINQFLADR